jgi:hypothetical protein
MDYILNSFQVTDEEYNKLDELFGDLAHYAAWQLIQKNVKNNHTDDQEDIVQEIRWASIKAASYFKRQVYLENCMRTAREYVTDPVVVAVLDELEFLWRNRTKHGANKQKFGEHQERLLDDIVDRHVPEPNRPKKTEPLQFNRKFITYCKAIIWNRQKSLGKKITREKTIRSGVVSLSEYDYLVSSSGKISAIKKK